MSTEVEIDPSFQLQPDPKTAPDSRVNLESSAYTGPGMTNRTPKKTSLMGVFNNNKSMQYESIDDTPPTAPSTPDGFIDDDIEIDLTANVVSAAADSAFGFDADDNDNLMQTEIPEIFPHQENGISAGEEQNQIVQPAQFKVPTQVEPKLEVVLDDIAGKQQQEQAGNEQAKKHIHAAHQQVGLVSAHTNELAKKNDGVFCSSLNGIYEEASNAQQPATGMESTEIPKGPALQVSKQRAVATPGLAEECARHENFEVVLDPSYFTTPEKKYPDAIEEAELKNSALAIKEVFDIQRDLEGFERQMKEESNEDNDQGMQQEENQESGILPAATSALPIAAAGVPQLPLENEAGESPMGTVEVSVEEPPEVKISVDTQPAPVEETKPKKEKKSRKVRLSNLTKKVKAKAISSKASVKAISLRASKVLKSVSVSSPNRKKKQEEVSSVPEKVIKPKAVWRAIEDPKSGRYYYYHRTTRETTWIKPEEYAAYERTMEKYELDRIAYEKYHQKPIEEIVIGQIDTSTMSQEASMKDHGKQDFSEEKKDVVVVGDELKRDDNKDDDHLQGLEGKPFDEEPRDAKPFDEAYGYGDKPKPFDEAYGYDDKPNLLPPLAVQGRIASHMTDKTQQINNISRSQCSGLESTEVEESSGLGSLSNLDEDKEGSQISFNSPLMKRARARANRASSSYRTRELRVEDLGSSRVTAETFNRRGRVVKGRGLSSNEERSCFSEQIPVGPFDQDDTFSALSETDLDFNMRRDNINVARRRALDDAIERKDGNLFSALLIGMQASSNGMQETHPGWNQTHVDRMIAEDDWEVVKSYFAGMTDQPSDTKSMPPSTPQTEVPPVVASPKSIDRLPDETASSTTDYSA